MKKLLPYIGKCFVAAVVSLVILSIVSSLYFNPPIGVSLMLAYTGTSPFIYFQF